MEKPTFEKSTEKKSLNDLEGGLGEGITSSAMRRRALALRVVSRRLERENALEHAKRAALGVGDAPK